ncbi:YfiR/HmsC family protein [Paracraurococcus lichenis]|uniref:YfiR/HmsC family protein n=1 Tax=Paracraurococcus lichenis TaxID=3064888 RepID=A0ABT9EA70_9PROT|nr:YfiR/HmsC family protein [Paracraurococcus sp. LOR1-02]MDO9713073.1 YfiR/HmsC family protein [Paracraurococcus sp. LOR1-02]
MRAGALTLRPRLVPTEAAGQAQVAALLLTEAALPEAEQIASALAGRGIPLIATSPSALDGSRVVMAVRSEPRVEILVSRAAAQAAGVTFSAAFRMMIQER